MTHELVVETARLLVTTWCRSDVDDLLAVHSDPDTMRFVRRGRPETRAETADLVEQYIAEHAGRGVTRWRLADRDGRLAGRAGFGEHADGRELGYTIRRDLWGQGLATEVAAALVAWHLAHAGGCPLYAYVAVGNPASRRVLDKTGFRHIRSEDHAGVPCALLRLPDAVTPPHAGGRTTASG